LAATLCSQAGSQGSSSIGRGSDAGGGPDEKRETTRHIDKRGQAEFSFGDWSHDRGGRCDCFAATQSDQGAALRCRYVSGVGGLFLANDFFPSKGPVFLRKISHSKSFQHILEEWGKQTGTSRWARKNRGPGLDRLVGGGSLQKLMSADVAGRKKSSTKTWRTKIGKAGQERRSKFGIWSRAEGCRTPTLLLPKNGYRLWHCTCTGFL